jgi:hypothetical protein
MEPLSAIDAPAGWTAEKMGGVIMRIGFLIIIAAVVGGSILLLSSDLNRAAVLGSEGYIDRGSKFGIAIGSSANEAGQNLSRQGLELSPEDGRSNCLDRRYDASHSVQVWEDNSWRRGTICLESYDDKVVSIGWYFSWAAP